VCVKLETISYPIGFTSIKQKNDNHEKADNKVDSLADFCISGYVKLLG